MRILPGKPKAHIQSLCAGEWGGLELIAYSSGKAVAILSGVNELLQTIYHDDELNCVALNEVTGAIAVSSSNGVSIYKPTADWNSIKKWIYHDKIDLEAPDNCPNFLSWGPGPESELLIGGVSLSLWTLPGDSNGYVRIWHKRLANPAKYAAFSHDGSLVASVGFSDRLVKVWRRQSFVSGDPQFDFSYLPHAATVTSIYWRRPLHRDMSFENVLYTLSNDQVLRVWSPSDTHDGHLLHLWSSIELGGLEISSSPLLPSEKASRSAKGLPSRFGAILDSNIFKIATESVVEHGPEGVNGAEMVQRLLEIANRSPELCVIIDSTGKLSVWGLENVGCKGTRTTNAFRIVQSVDTGLNLPSDASYVQLFAFNDKSAEKDLTFVVHIFGGEILWFKSRLDELLDPSPRRKRMKSAGFWYGHSEAIDSLYRTPNGRSLLSSSKETEHVLWVCGKIDKGNVTLIKKSSLSIIGSEKVQHTVVLEDGAYLITLHKVYVIFWDCSSGHAKEIERRHFDIEGKWMCLILLPEVADKSHTYHIAAINSQAEGIAWEVRARKWTDLPPDGHCLQEISRFDLKMKTGLRMMVPVDPVGWEFTLSGNLDKFNPDVALSVSDEGVLRSWTARVSTQPTEVSWLETGKIETLIANPSLARGSSIRKIAVVDDHRTELTIWDIRSQQLELKNRYSDNEIVQDLDWTCTPDSQSILAVGFPHRVLLLSQLRYDYLNAGPAWAPFREISIESMTNHRIGDSTWLENGTLVIGAGNQLFLNSKYLPPPGTGDAIVDHLQISLSHQSKPVDIFEAVSRLNGPVPVYHPQFLQQCILAGKVPAVEKVLISLHNSLKNHLDVEPLKLSNFLDIEMTEFIDEADDTVRLPLTSRRSYVANPFDGYLDEEESFDEELSSSLSTLLKSIPIPYLTGQEQIALAGINECVSEVAQHRRSIDENGSRYLLFFKQHSLRRDIASEELSVSFREIVWALHSNSQEILVDLVSKTFQNKMTWKQAREAGIFMWLQDIESVRKQFEILARNHYTQTEERNPIDCSLYYLALKKKTVLVGLWRMASWNKEQQATHKFLSNNFNEERWKTAALKNAYALMGKQRFEYAAAFFLLANSVKDAINVCFNQMNDMQLAIAIARVYEGDDGPNLRSLLNDKVIPLAAKEGNKWLATWAFWMLGRRDLAVRAIIAPIYSLIDAPESPEMDSKLFLTDDPALVILYQQIRDKTLQTLRGAERISPSAEFQFVLHTARLYDRMGCDVLALGLVKNWAFLQPAEQIKPLIEHDPRRFKMRRRSSITVADLVADEQHLHGNGVNEGDGKSMHSSKSGLVKPPPSVFEEPNMDMFSHFDF